MKTPLIAVWLLLPCNSAVVEDPATNTTTAIACPNTFREGYGPFLAEGWTPPAAVAARQEASVPKYSYKAKPKKAKKKKKRKRRR